MIAGPPHTNKIVCSKASCHLIGDRMIMIKTKFFVTLLLLCFTNIKFASADTAIKFDGTSSYASFDVWQPSGPFKIVAWLGEVPTDRKQKAYLLSNSDTKEFVLFTKSSIQIKFGNKFPGIWNKFDFEKTRFLEITVKKGELIASDGVNTFSIKDECIVPTDVSFNWLFRRSNMYSKGALQGLGLIDLKNIKNSRNYGFSSTGEPQFVSSKVDSFFQLHNVTDSDLISGLDVPNPKVSNIDNISQLADLIYERHSGNPMVNSRTNTGNDYAWKGYYWLRTYIRFYEQTKDLKYLDMAIELANKAFNDTDTSRVTHNSYTLESYVRAPKYFLNDRSQAAPGWHRSSEDPSITVLSDGMILNGIMRIVDIIKSEELLGYDEFANTYISKAQEIIESHDSSFSRTKSNAIQGSYYYVNINNEHYGDSGLYKNPLAHNHNLTMATAMVYLDKWSDGLKDYKPKINDIISFFVGNLEYLDNGACVWNYNWDYRGSTKERYEDIDHGHIDVGFFVVAEKEGYFTDLDVMECLAKTAVEHIAIGPGPIPEFVTGEGVSVKSEQIAFSYDWRGLAKFEPSIINRSNNILRHAASNPTWYRQYTALAMSLNK